MAVLLLCSSTARFCNGGVTVFIISVMFVLVSQQRRLSIMASRKCCEGENTEEIRVAKQVVGGGLAQKSIALRTFNFSRTDGWRNTVEPNRALSYVGI